jgi:RNA polymerase sigma factor (sigma-70 family)
MGFDPEVFESVLRSRDRLFRSICIKIVRDYSAVDDVLQDGLLQAWRFRHQFNGQPSDLERWIGRIIQRAALMELRRRRSRGDHMRGEMPVSASMADSGGTRRILASECVNLAPEPYRGALIRMLGDAGKGNKEAVWRHRGIALIREKLKGEC